MDVLVIGGTRFLGYQTAWRLLAAGHRVTLLNRGTLPDPFEDRLERLHADRTTPQFAEALHGRAFDAAVDFAAYTEADAAGVVQTLEGRLGHYVFVSTGQVYLVRRDAPRPAREEDYAGPLLDRPVDPHDLAQWQYGMDKRAAEDLLQRAWQEGRFPSTRLRIPMVNGERDHQRRVESYLWRLLDGGPVLLPDGGEYPVRHVYSGTVAAAIVNLLGKPETFGEAYNLSQSESPTLAELVRMLGELLGAPARTAAVPRARIEAAGIDPRDVSPFSVRWMSVLDARRAERELGFVHPPVREYLGRIVAWFLNAVPPEPPENYLLRSRELELVG